MRQNFYNRLLDTARCCWLGGGVIIALAAPLGAWETRLQDGSPVTIDPDTRKPVVSESQRSLWDGIHRLEDGSILTIRQGVAVPTESLIHPPDPPLPHPARTGETSPCQPLIDKVCGVSRACAHSAACKTAEQLGRFEAEEQREKGLRPGRISEGGQQCQTALANHHYFVACGGEWPSDDACRRLVLKVCGSHDACSSRESCRITRQLQDLERQDKKRGLPAGASGSQCEEALQREAFFQVCDDSRTP
ncbi:MAG: hypothetical protein WCP34_08250 [Pseudomonadota bacterium]